MHLLEYFKRLWTFGWRTFFVPRKSRFFIDGIFFATLIYFKNTFCIPTIIIINVFVIDLLFSSDIRKGPIERNYIAGQQIKFVDLKELLLLEQILRFHHNRIAVLPRIRSRVEIIRVNHVVGGIGDLILRLTDVVTDHHVDSPAVNVFLLIVPVNDYVPFERSK